MLACVLIALQDTHATVYNGVCGEHLTWTLDSEDSVLVISGRGDMSGRDWYERRDLIKSVSFPNGLTSVQNDAFLYCENLRTVILPDSVTSIGSRSFAYCFSLTQCDLGQGIREIGENAFANDSALVSLNIPTAVTTLPLSMCINCVSLQSVTLPDGLKQIGSFAFERCSSLPEVHIPDSVTLIDEMAFEWCTALTTISLPDEVRVIKQAAFRGCSALQQIRFGKKIAMIESNAFRGDESIKEIVCDAVYPPSVESSAFVSIPDSAWLIVPVQSIEAYSSDPVWGRFRIKKDVELDHIIVQAEETTANFIWPTDSSANSYEIDIYKDGNVFCKLTLGAKGQLLGIAFSAPGRRQQASVGNHPSDDGDLPYTLSFMVTGLDKASRYSYVLSTLDADGKPLHVYIGDFATTGYEGELQYPEGNEVMPTPPIIPGDPDAQQVLTGTEQASVQTEGGEVTRTARRLLHDGQLLIERGGELYNAAGMRLR